MTKNHSPGGKRVVLGLLAATFSVVAVFAAKQVVAGPSAPASEKLGKVFNQGLLGASKLGMGFSQMICEVRAEQLSKQEEAPSGMIAAETEAVFVAEAPRGVQIKGKDNSFVAKQGKALARVSLDAFVSAAKVDEYAYSK